MTGSFYSANSSLAKRRFCEHCANRWAYNYVIPFEELYQAFTEGKKTVEQLAEYFHVSYEFVFKALRYYSRKGNIVPGEGLLRRFEKIFKPQKTIRIIKNKKFRLSSYKTLKVKGISNKRFSLASNFLHSLFEYHCSRQFREDKMTFEEYCKIRKDIKNE